MRGLITFRLEQTCLAAIFVVDSRFPSFSTNSAKDNAGSRGKRDEQTPFPDSFFFAVLIALLSRRHDCTLTIGSGSENIPPEKWPIAKNVHRHYMPLTNSQLRKIKSWVLHFSCVAKYDNRAQENATDFPDRSVSPEIRRHQRTGIKLSISHFNGDTGGSMNNSCACYEPLVISYRIVIVFLDPAFQHREKRKSSELWRKNVDIRIFSLAIETRVGVKL